MKLLLFSYNFVEYSSLIKQFCFAGNLKLVAALMAKKVEVHGDLKQAMKLETLMGKSKL